MEVEAEVDVGTPADSQRGQSCHAQIPPPPRQGQDTEGDLVGSVPTLRGHS